MSVEECEELEGLAGWPQGALDDKLRELELTMRRTAAEHAAVLAAAEARQVPDLDGHRSLKAYVRAATNQPGSVASAQVRRARFCRDFRVASDALWAGHVGIAQIDVLARLATHPRVGNLVDEQVVAMFLEHAEHFSFRDFSLLVDRWSMLVDPDGAEPDDGGRRDATVFDIGGELSVRVTGGDPLTTERVKLIFDRFTEAEYRKDLEQRRREHGAQADLHALPRTDRERRHSAFVAIFDTANAHADLPGKPVDACVNVIIDAKTLSDAFSRAGITLPDGSVFDPNDQGWSDRRRQALLTELLDPQAMLHRRCETQSGQPIHPALVARAMLTGHIRTVLVDAHREIVEVSSGRRLFTGVWAVAAHLARSTCEHPGCELPGHLCDIDHRVPYSFGGPTAQPNSAVECNTHNRLKHTRRWRTVRARNQRLITVRPDGTLMLPAGERPPPLRRSGAA